MVTEIVYLKVLFMKNEFRTFSGCGDGFSEAMAIRTRVFVEEQHVPVELERDEYDVVAVHLLLMRSGQAIGTGRFFADPDDVSVARLGRVAVLPEFRGLGLGRAIIDELISQIKAEARYRRILIHAQKGVVGLYGGAGFKAIGDEFLEAGIVHQEMFLDCRIT